VAEVNEEILEQYLKIVKGWFYIGDIPFTVPYNYSNIDVLGYDPTENQYYDFEVKFRSAYSLTNNDKDIEYLVDQFEKYREQREAKRYRSSKGMDGPQEYCVYANLFAGT